MNGTDEIAKENEVDWCHRGAQKRHHQLEIIKTLGEGTHGKVLLAKDPASTQQVQKYSYRYVLRNYSPLSL